MSLAPYVRIVAQGAARARPLTQDEAQEAMSIVLAGNAEPEALGALLMVLRLRGETVAEIAGFTAALRSTSAALPAADLDWPCYAAGRTRGAPLFLLAAKLVTQAGYSVLLHGWNSHQATGASPRAALKQLELEGGGLSYLPLETLNPRAFDLLRLRDTFGLRSCINTVLRMWNPTQAPTSVMGVFHPTYRGLQSSAARLLGDQNLIVIKGGGGEFEVHPAKDIKVFGLRDGVELDETLPATFDAHRRLHESDDAVDIADIWSGASQDPFAEAVITSTAALALWSLKAAPTLAQSRDMAALLWRERSPLQRKTA